MSRAAVIAWLGVFVVGLTVILGTYLYLHPPDYGLIAENGALLDALPAPPGARMVSERSTWHGTGYTTTRTYALERPSGAAAVVGFYVSHLRGRCALLARTAAGGASFRCGDAAVSVRAAGARYSLAADARPAR